MAARRVPARPQGSRGCPGSQRWACLIGQPVAHSLSPALHNAAFVALGLEAHYELRDVAPAQLRDAVAALRDPACLGANVTAPHKESVLPLLDALSDAARALGAVNTIVNRSGTLVGDNTDAAGLARWMHEAGIRPTGRATVVLGAGGAARAAVWALDRLGARTIRVLNRTPQRAQALVEQLQHHLERAELAWGRLVEAAEPADQPVAIVVNATSLGHHGGAPSVHPSWYSPESVAIELVYNPPETGFMQAARAAGARAENGLGMLVHQAALACECWTGTAPPLDVYVAALRDRVGA